MKKKPSKFPLLEPIELAKLAAILRPEFQAAGALKVAMEFYVEAVLFCRESSSMSFEDLITRFGDDKRHLALMAEPIKEAVQAQWADTLELDPEKDDDPVRQYLARQGLRRLKKAQTVLDNFRRYYNAPLPKDKGRAVTIWQRGTDGEWRCAVDIWNAEPTAGRTRGLAHNTFTQSAPAKINAASI